MNIQVHLYKNSNCEICRMIIHELVDNPPKGDVIIHHIRNSNKLPKHLEIIVFPTIIITCNDKEIIRYNGFIDSNTINSVIEKYETESVV